MNIQVIIACLSQYVTFASDHSRLKLAPKSLGHSAQTKKNFLICKMTKLSQYLTLLAQNFHLPGKRINRKAHI
jgi:hypothetical protein